MDTAVRSTCLETRLRVHAFPVSLEPYRAGERVPGDSRSCQYLEALWAPAKKT